MSSDEALAQGLELTRRAGINEDVFAVVDPADTIHAIRRQYLARLRKLSPVEFPRYRQGTIAFELKEKL